MPPVQNEHSMDLLLYFGLAILCCVYAVAKYNSSKAGKGPWLIMTPLIRFFFQLAHIPAIGPSGPLTSYWGALRYIFRSREINMEGYRNTSSEAIVVTCVRELPL